MKFMHKLALISNFIKIYESFQSEFLIKFDFQERFLSFFVYNYCTQLCKISHVFFKLLAWAKIFLLCELSLEFTFKSSLNIVV